MTLAIFGVTLIQSDQKVQVISSQSNSGLYYSVISFCKCTFNVTNSSRTHLCFNLHSLLVIQPPQTSRNTMTQFIHLFETIYTKQLPPSKVTPPQHPLHHPITKHNTMVPIWQQCYNLTQNKSII